LPEDQIGSLFAPAGGTFPWISLEVYDGINTKYSSRYYRASGEWYDGFIENVGYTRSGTHSISLPDLTIVPLPPPPMLIANSNFKPHISLTDTNT